MNLTDFIKNIENIDNDAIIFLEYEDDANSDIILLYAEDDSIVREKNGHKYFYLIEVFLAKEFVEDWIASLDYTPTIEETAKRLYEYGCNDA
mgnify:CR=1 FL=1